MRIFLLAAIFLTTTVFAESIDRIDITHVAPDGSTIRRLVPFGGGYVAVGDAVDGSRRVVALARYDRNGALKTEFGNGGIVKVAVGNTSDLAFAGAETADRKILVAGWAFDSESVNISLQRYTKKGALDATFGIGGIARYGIAGWILGAYAMTLQIDGKILVAAQAVNPAGNHYYFTVARFNANGAIDTSFGNAGLAMSEFFSSFPHAIAVAPNGKIVIGGHFPDNGIYHFLMQRWTKNGVLDTTFGNAGTVITDFGTGVHSVLEKLALDDNDGIYAAGSVTTSPEVLALLHYKANGTLDASFGTAGKALVAIGSAAHANDLVLDGNRITVAGYGNPSTRRTFALARFKLNGKLDASFGTGGIETIPVGVGDAQASSLILDKQGRLVAGGEATPDGGPSQFAIVRFDQERCN